MRLVVPAFCRPNSCLVAACKQLLGCLRACGQLLLRYTWRANSAAAEHALNSHRVRCLVPGILVKLFSGVHGMWCIMGACCTGC
jgi:hypothetical protein